MCSNPMAAPVEGVLIHAEPDDANDVTDANGFYEIRVSSNWAGGVSAQKKASYLSLKV